MALCLCMHAGAVRAQDVLPLRARASAGGALMTSADQTGALGFDTFGATGKLHLGYALAPWMNVQLGFGAGAFPGTGGETGAAVAPTAGVLATRPDGDVRPFVYLDGGAAFTGPYSRPYFGAGLGVDFQVTRAFTLGPLLGYGHIVQLDRPGYSTDARSVELCMTVTFRPIAQPAARERDTFIFHTEHVRAVHVRDPAAPPEPEPPAEPSPELAALLDDALPKARVELLAPVLFELGSDELEPVGVAMLHEVARELGVRRDIKLLEIQGYTDARGDDALNHELSARRAQRVLDWLVAHGVEPERLRTAARGASDPVEDGAAGEQAHEQNRRVVFRVIEAGAP